MVGLTGDVGAGKSTLADVWQGQGAHIVNADRIAKEQWKKEDIVEAALQRWGDSIMTDGAVDYKKVAGMAFADRAEYDFLRSLIHPGTIADMQKEAALLRGWVVVEVPLLFETGVPDWVDYVVYVSADPVLRARRNGSRGWDEAEIERRESFMMKSVEKVALSDLELINDGDLSLWIETAREWGTLFAKMAGVIEMTTQCPTEECAKTLARKLIERRLAACVNIGRIKSVFSWGGKVCLEAEWSLLCKTTRSLRKEVIRCIKANHPYELPAITATESDGSDPATLEWIVRSCKNGLSTETVEEHSE